MAPPRLLLLDFDGVLAHYDRRARCRHLARSLGVDELKVHEVLFGANGLEARSDRGELDLPGYLQALRQSQGWLLEPRHFLAARQAATVADPAMLQLCRRLAPRLTLAVLSNNGAWFAEHVVQVEQQQRRARAHQPAAASRKASRAASSVWPSSTSPCADERKPAS